MHVVILAEVRRTVPLFTRHLNLDPAEKHKPHDNQHQIVTQLL